MRLASDAIAERRRQGDRAALEGAPPARPLSKAAKAVQANDDEARRKLLDKLNQVAANLGLDEARAAAEAAEAAKGAPSGGEAAALRAP